jgi:hypothetical protein
MHMAAVMNAPPQTPAQSPRASQHVRLDLTHEAHLSFSNASGEQHLAALAIKVLRDHLSRPAGPSPARAQRGSTVSATLSLTPSLAWSQS